MIAKGQDPANIRLGDTLADDLFWARTRAAAGRAGIVLNGSPLFNGAAESGPSKIRQWLLESG